jgi:aminopeptidase N
MRTERLILSVALAAGLCSAAAGADDPRIDPDTGRQLANYPPDRHFDHLHMRLEIDIPDMGKPMFEGMQMLRVTPIGRTRDVLKLDAGPLQIRGISVDGRAQRFTHDGRVLMVTLDPPMALGETGEVRIEYSVEYPKGDGTGLTWSAGRDTARNDTDRAAQIHSQGQPDYNHTWFACQDFPNEMLTTELVVTVEDPYIVGSNGHLVRTTFAGTRDGRKRTTWHWLQDKPHCAYLVSLVVGRFGIVGLPPKGAAPTRFDGRAVECYLYTPLGTEGTAQRAYARTPAMLEYFQRQFGEAYPWDKYSQALVRRFAAGGMENTSATTMRSQSATSRPGQEDDIIAHEAAHQWFGDLLTCKGWEHGWLNEGWASFSEALWDEEAARAASGNSRQAYQRKIARFLAVQRMSNSTTAPDTPPLVSNRYSNGMENFMKPNDIYSKGAIVLHMLRERLGDEVFWAGTRAYVQKHKFGIVETDEFRRCLEEASGLSLERFFTQWCYRPGLPRLSVTLSWAETEGGRGTLGVEIEQTQQVDADNPAYAFTLPLLIKSGDRSEVRRVEVTDRSTTAMFELPAKPDDIVVDPSLSFASANKVVKPTAMWIRQLDDESVLAQVEAARHLAALDDVEAAAALSRVVVDEARVDVVRQAAEAGIARLFRPAPVQILEVSR